MAFKDCIRNTSAPNTFANLNNRMRGLAGNGFHMGKDKGKFRFRERDGFEGKRRASGAYF